MGFTRDEMANYEAKPQNQVDDKVNPFTGNVTPAAKTLDDDDQNGADPSGDELDETDPDEQGDGTSDENQLDSSTNTSADPSGETETNESQEQDGNTVQQQPKKGSARERIQELVEERDGYRAYGEYAQEQIAASNARVTELTERLEKAGKSEAQIAAAVAKSEPAGPVPTYEDPDVNYDPAKFKAKMDLWVNKTVTAQVQEVVKTLAPQSKAEDEGQKVVAAFTARIETAKTTHEDFEDVVKPLPRLSEGAARRVVLSEEGPEILYYLGKHIKEAVRIVRLSPDEQIEEIGAIRAQIKKAKSVLPSKTDKTDTTSRQTATVPAKPKSQSNAPVPPTRIPAGGRAQPRDVTDPGMGMEEFARRHRQERVTAREQNRMARTGRR